MDQFDTDKLRNIALLAHSGSGKTSLVEAMHFATGAINRLGRVEDGTTISDFEPEEHKHQTSRNPTTPSPGDLHRKNSNKLSNSFIALLCCLRFA